MKDLRARLRAALARLFPGVYFDLNWIKEPDHRWHDGGDPIIDRWHVVRRRQQDEARRRWQRDNPLRLTPAVSIPAGEDDLPF